MATFSARALRPLASGLGVVPLLAASYHTKGVSTCEGKPASFVPAECTKNETHTHNTRLITLRVGAIANDWAHNGPIANVVVRAMIDGQKESGCCACCKCPPPCGCPKGPNGCCGCCSCPGTCGCPKVVASTTVGEGSSAVARPYNPICATSGNSITLLVKRYPDSKMGSKLHSLNVGDSVEVRGPNQQWTFEKGKYHHYGLIAGGTGITPLVQAAQHILKHDTAKVSMITFNKTPEDILLRPELDKLERQYPGRFVVLYAVAEEKRMGVWFEGTPSLDTLKFALPAPAGGVLVMCCGRKEMTEAVAGPKTPDFQQGEVGGILKELGYTEEQVWKV